MKTGLASSSRSNDKNPGRTVPGGNFGPPRPHPLWTKVSSISERTRIGRSNPKKKKEKSKKKEKKSQRNCARQHALEV